MTTSSPAHDRDRITDRIRKLLAFNAETATEAEVENALALAAQLMERHAIERDEVEADGTGDAANEADHGRTLRHGPAVSSIAWWERVLVAAAVDAVPGVGSLIERDRQRTPSGGTSSRFRVGWFGPADAVEVAMMLHDRTWEVIATMATIRYGGCYRGAGRSYAEGFVEAIARAVSSRRQASPDRARVTALVARSDAANHAWLERRFGMRLRSVRPRGPAGAHHRSAFEQGERDGRAHDFTAGRPHAADRG